MQNTLKCHNCVLPQLQISDSVIHPQVYTEIGFIYCDIVQQLRDYPLLRDYPQNFPLTLLIGQLQGGNQL